MQFQNVILYFAKQLFNIQKMSSENLMGKLKLMNHILAESAKEIVGEGHTTNNLYLESSREKAKFTQPLLKM